MTTNDEQYVPTDGPVRYQYVVNRMREGATRTHAEREYTRWLAAHDARVRRDAEAELDSWMTRAYEAEGKLWKAEKRLAGWMEHWNATARTGAVDEVAAVLEANARADQAEARIKAVRDVLDRWRVDGYDALLRRIRSALDGDA